jgi:hypothetical protein
MAAPSGVRIGQARRGAAIRWSAWFGTFGFIAFGLADEKLEFAPLYHIRPWWNTNLSTKADQLLATRGAAERGIPEGV